MDNNGNSDDRVLISNRGITSSRNRNISIVEENDNIVVSVQPGINSENSIPSENTNVQYSHSSLKAYVAVIILCFINLINYMDRYTLAGLDYFSSTFSCFTHCHF